MVELVDTLALGASAVRRGSSSLLLGTTDIIYKLLFSFTGMSSFLFGGDFQD